MEINAYEIDEDGFIVEQYLVEVNEDGNPINDEFKDLVTVQLPQPNFHRPKWSGKEWVEDATPEEIAEMIKPKEAPLTDIEIVSQLLTERELELMLQGQQLVAFELKLAELEAKLNV